MKRTSSFVLTAAAAVLVATGCGSAPTTAAESTAVESISAAATSASSAASSPNAATVIPVTIAAGAVTPTNAEETARAGQPIVLEVSSDTPDSVHVHSVPEHVFDIQARPDQRFEFTVDVPGRVDIELHELNRTIVTITVLPG